MTLIEGVGDEVLQFLGILLVVLLGVVAWWSTGIRDLPQIRTILILERRTQNTSTQQATLVSQHVSGIDTGQGDQSGCRQRRLSASRSVVNKREITVTRDIHENAASEEPSNSDPSVISEIDRNASGDDLFEPQTDQNTESNMESNGDNIRIRLKYLNDDQKLVEGRLQELLGDFKRRHFSMELSAQKLVRLIFNGQILQRDDQTLQGCGLYDNCVVHCLVHAQQNTQRSNAQQHSNSPPPDWNLGGLLYTCLSVLLCLAWICRYNYSHLFSLTTTTALVGLTGMFAVSVIGLHMPEQLPNN